MYFVELFDNSGVVDRKAAQLTKTLCSLIVLVHLDEVSRSLWEDEETGK